MLASLPANTPVEHVIEGERSTVYAEGVVISYTNGSYVIHLKRVCAACELQVALRGSLALPGTMCNVCRMGWRPAAAAPLSGPSPLPLRLTSTYCNQETPWTCMTPAHASGAAWSACSMQASHFKPTRNWSFCSRVSAGTKHSSDDFHCVFQNHLVLSNPLLTMPL
jgi:hypothetical protein